MCDDHPLQVSALLPLVEVFLVVTVTIVVNIFGQLVAPTARHFDNLRRFIDMKLPTGFPVQLGTFLKGVEIP